MKKGGAAAVEVQASEPVSCFFVFFFHSFVFRLFPFSLALPLPFLSSAKGPFPFPYAQDSRVVLRFAFCSFSDNVTNERRKKCKAGQIFFLPTPRVSLAFTILHLFLPTFFLLPST